ncbi:MAG: DNA recombination protein RmuC [Clostridium sp.]|nr:DNA recombination protein RmuC [Clostridium sp.]
MEYIIIGLLVLLIVLVIVLISKNNVKNSNEANMTERLGRFEVNINKEINDFKNELNRGLNEDFDKLNNKIETRLNLINDKVNERLDQNFEKTNKTFTNVLERLSKIDEAQKKIDGLSNDIVSLQSILTDKKSRGIFGEVNLKHILVSVFGEKNDKIYSLQYTLPNGTIADSVLFAPAPLGTIAIDSKFPLESYRMMVDKKLPQEIRERYEKQFKSDVKKHIDAISNKYIIEGVTSDQAIMFLPAEAIFAEINAYHQDIIEYAYRKKVWITSPTTLISTLTVIQMIIKNIERDKYTSVIHEELNKLGVEFSRYKERWDKLSKSIQTVNNDVESVYITTEKISKKFDVISGVEIDKINNEDYDKLNV